MRSPGLPGGSMSSDISWNPAMAARIVRWRIEAKQVRDALGS